MNILMILSHTAVHTHLHATELVPIALITMLGAVVFLAFRRQSASRK